MAWLFATPWPSYILIAALQLKVIWGIWVYRDMTSGDTSSYLNHAYQWSHHLTVNILWSPLYTSFYGTVFALTGDAATATWLHRALIVMAATTGVLAVARRLLTPPVALAVAAWWAVMPINFNVLYEVHLFTLCMILGIWLIAGDSDRPVGRGIALGLLILTLVLVRNEYTVAASIFAAVCLWREYRSIARETTVSASMMRRRVWCYVVPIGLALVICLGFYSRSIVKGDSLRSQLHLKLVLNPCQLYAVGYQQRHPEWTRNPWTECYGLQQATFGSELPTLGDMARANLPALLEHFGWNVMLVPAGLQLGLFNGTWGGPNPDFLPLEHPDDSIAVVLSVLAIIVVLTAALRIIAEPGYWRSWFGERRGLWIAMLSTAAVSVPIILTQRPRPSYLFFLTAFLMMVIATAGDVLLRRSPRLAAYGGAAALGLALLFAPPYYLRHKSAKPLEASYRALMKLGPSVRMPKGRVVLGDHAQDLLAYTQLAGVTVEMVDDYSLLAAREPDQTIMDLLDKRNVSAFFIQPRIQPAFSSLPGAAALLTSPETIGWQTFQTRRDDGRTWTLVVRRHSRPPRREPPADAPR